MKLHRWDDLKREKLSPEKLQAIERRAKRKALLLTLRELRQMSGKTQIEVAEVAKMTQGELSKAERREDHLLSTLKRYVEALGGELEVAAVFGDKRVRLRGV
jgi:predicted transcriptional regulator